MNSLSAVFFYEWRRTLTFARLGWWFVLAMFPVAITFMIRRQPRFAAGMRPDEIATVWSIVFYLLIPSVCCMLGVFLNAAPAIASELEQRSWIYLATRPRGVMWMMLGKFLVAVVWAVTSAVLSITLATIVSQMDFAAWRGAETVSEGLIRLFSSSLTETLYSDQSPAIFRTWWTMVRLSILSACAYSALFLMIGASFPNRSMVFSVGYVALVEVVLSLIPAVINRITVQYRLRSLMINWADPVRRDQMQGNMFFKYVFADGGNTEQILWLIGLTVCFLGAALLIAEKREFTSAAESDI
ncbi:MAG: hypothetical protein KDA91_09795 [Planctomycetaceae bacterium]|nr:hypothetical protein [Planctomycetaceae bacterium]